MAQGIDLSRVLVFCPDDPREAIMATPALRALKRHCPSDTMIDVIAPRPAEAIAPMLPFVDRVSHGRDEGERERIDRISRLHYDTAIIFTGAGESPHAHAYSCYLAGIKVRIGMSAEFAGGVLSHWIKPLPNIHPVDRHLSLVASIGLTDAGRRLELHLPARTTCPVLAHPSLTGGYLALMCDAAIDNVLAVKLVNETKIPVVSAYASPDGLSLVCRAPGRDAAVYEGGQDGKTEMLKGELITKAMLTVTDDTVTALMAEALGCPVLFLALGAGPDRQYWPMESPVLKSDQTAPEAIAASVQKMLASMRS